MKRFYVTFPCGGGLADCYATVEAEDETAARLAVIGVYGRDGWAGVYPEHSADRCVHAYNLELVDFGHGRGVSAPERA